MAKRMGAKTIEIAVSHLAMTSRFVVCAKGLILLVLV
jgi:hypothetical protein